ncbi:TadE/TadG family type IV pilus assembly protein [uncultured Roseibium sp.]|uniref:TadE/TadG family type IV pilus assembly protein n=1 Tax=uncultured Roseibium sp. TaxID=1936171 RepID=UPI003217606B
MMPPGSAARFFPKTARRFKADQRGIAAVEFALLLPFLLIFLIGMSETVTALNTDRKVSQVASTVADLVAQAETISTDEITDMMTVTEDIMAPYPSDPLDIIIASVTFDDEGAPKIDWSRNKDGAKPSSWTDGSAPPIDIPAGISVAGTSLIIGQSSYTYVPLFASMLQNIFPRAASMTLGDTYFLKPRLTTTVTLTGS